MRHVTMTGIFILAGSAGGIVVVSADYLLGGAMGALAGFVAAVVVLAYPRERDYPNNNFWSD